MSATSLFDAVQPILNPGKENVFDKEFVAIPLSYISTIETNFLSLFKGMYTSSTNIYASTSLAILTTSSIKSVSNTVPVGLLALFKQINLVLGVTNSFNSSILKLQSCFSSKFNNFTLAPKERGISYNCSYEGIIEITSSPASTKAYIANMLAP